MDETIQDGSLREILRPTLFRGSNTALFYFLIFVGGIYVTIEFVFLKEIWNSSVSSFFICWFTPLVLVVVWSLVARFSVSLCVYDKKLVIKNHSPDSMLRIPDECDLN